MATRPTISDLARAAGVSVATVDRVLNGRHRVREETARRVYDAANAIGYHAIGLLRQRVFQDLPQYRLGFVLQRPQQHFYQAFAQELKVACNNNRTARLIPQIAFAEMQTQSAIVETLYRTAQMSDAVAVVSPDYAGLSITVDEIKRKGIPVFSLLSDIASGIRDGYVGLNNRKAGRTAAWMIARGAKSPGKVAIFVGSHRFTGHELREVGFQSYLREHAPGFEVLDTFVNLETSEITHETTVNLLNEHPDLVGLYIAGGGMEGAISAIREEGFPRKLQLVVNELTPESRNALSQDIVTMAIHTPLPALCRELVALMITAMSKPKTAVPGQTFLPFDIYLPENI
ncbi:LacI family DNA-binding transcriptional regulator [Shinella sp. BYT-45]|uniref:LacI family DNA-binding transcriptional regulator n=1 Tax=Shinella sp. BYT-45 TaxID=3377377 RepID=UPI00397FE976